MDTHTPPSILGRRGELSTGMFAAAFAWTLLFHGVIIGLVIWGTATKEEALEEQIEPKMLEFEDVELLALGKPKPPKALPTISNPAPKVKKAQPVALKKTDAVPTSKPPPKVTPTDDEPPKPADVDAKEVPDAPDDDLLNAIEGLNDPNRPTNDEAPEGDAKGVAGGSLSDAALASLMNTYQAKLMLAFRSKRTVPTTLSAEQVKAFDKKAQIYIRLSQSGNIVSYKWVRRSGNDQYDDSIETAVKKFMVKFGANTLPLPDSEEVKQEVLKKGLRLTGG